MGVNAQNVFILTGKMKRLRKIRKWGHSHVVVLTQFDMKDLDLKNGDEVDVADLVRERKGK